MREKSRCGPGAAPKKNESQKRWIFSAPIPPLERIPYLSVLKWFVEGFKPVEARGDEGGLGELGTFESLKLQNDTIRSLVERDTFGDTLRSKLQ